MARKETPAAFVTIDRAAREAEAAKTSRLRALRLAKEAEDAAAALRKPAAKSRRA